MRNIFAPMVLASFLSVFLLRMKGVNAVSAVDDVGRAAAQNADGIPAFMSMILAFLTQNPFIVIVVLAILFFLGYRLSKPKSY